MASCCGDRAARAVLRSGGFLRQGVPTIGGCLLVAASACAAHTDRKCVDTAPSASASAAPSASALGPMNSKDAVILSGLANALRDGLPRPRPNQFETPESALQFVLQKLASRDIAGALVAFPVAEHYERVTLKDRVKFTGMLAAGTVPLDDDPYGRLSHALSMYMADYRQIAFKVLSDNSGGVVTVTEANMSAVLQEFDGARLKALQVISIKNTHPESRHEPNPIDRAMGVTEKTMRDVTVKLDDRQIVVTASIGRIVDNWRVLSMF